jgi:hypothetical protein
VALACAEGGIVLDGNGNVIYKQKKAAEYNTIAGTFAYQSCETKEESLMACCYMSILSAGYTADYSVVRETNDWEEAMAAAGQLRGLNLSGVDLDTALGYLSDDIPFAVRIDDGRFVLVISYNASYIRYYDPIEGEEVRVTRGSFVETMQENGNTVYTYIKY